MKKIIALCAVLLFLPTNLWADTITFKSGKKVDGNIKSMTNEAVTVEIFGVTEMTYDLADIREVNGQPVELKPAAVEAPAAEETPAVDLEPAAPNTGFSQNEKVMLGAGAAAIFMTFLGVILLAGFAIYVFCSICLQLIAKKTGTEPAWLAWIPVANLFLSCKIGGLSYLWLLAFLVPFVNVLVSIYIWYRISEVRGKPGLLALLMLVPVANLVFMGYLAFSESGTGTVPPPVKGEEPASPFQDHPYRPPLE
ncbi:MAG: DUF5684 domain-containing protein [Candidatus Omnitrophota bacterium]